ncbi:Indigoidine synthase A like protein-domain-containing protein [Cantharellus anzutake]|uniref:Indigoidine synthase A like protein-domain-containing protein n=1 Tax=Cantharellus anzutake TaxID=1750568 RepID=UPI0019089F00|nr:Indigoidine synthase A like protein-domain-containing protein [Cantharellus anzutake]KAF8335455.1 Indigoidine synthase A like protein-domain-containing protein [Cantharellus anzutake]
MWGNRRIGGGLVTYYRITETEFEELIQRAMQVVSRHTSRLRARTPSFARGYFHGKQHAWPLTIHPEVKEAINAGRPVVALESAIITHGMPHPINLDTALSCERIIRSTGAIPATIGLLSGAFTVKVSRRDLAPAVATRRDGGTTIAGTMVIAHLAGISVFSTGGLGGVHRGGELSLDISADLTELGRTPIAVVSAGVKSILDIGRTLEYLETEGVTVGTFGPTKEFPAFFSRRSGFQNPWNFDSATQVARMLYAQHQLNLNSGALIACPIPEEYETAGLKIQQAVEQAIQESEENGVSKTGKDATPWLLRRVAELTGGSSIPNNIALIENTSRIGGEIAVEYAKLVAERAEHASARVPILSDGYTIGVGSPSNIAPKSSLSASIANQAPKARLVVLGAAAVDVVARADTSTDSTLIAQSTVPGQVSITLGGVARNMAEAAHRSLSSLDPRGSSKSSSSYVQLVSPIGTDELGAVVSTEITQIGMRSDGLLSGLSGGNRRTPVCNMVLTPAGELLGGVSDFSALDTFGFSEVLQASDPNIVALDGNLSSDIISDLVQFASERNIPIWFEPTSIVKSTRILPALCTQYLANPAVSSLQPVTFISPNILELEHLFRCIRDPPLEQASDASPSSFSRWFETIDHFQLGPNFSEEIVRLARSGPSLEFLAQKGVVQMTIQLLPFFQHIIVKCGSQGVFVAMHLHPQEAIQSAWLSTSTDLNKHLVVNRTGKGDVLIFQHFPAHSLPNTSVVNVTGAGDSLVGSLLASLIEREDRNVFHNPEAMREAMQRAQRAAVFTLCSPFAVSPELSTLTYTSTNRENH